VSPAAPFLKWVGGKRQILPSLLSHIPRRIDGTYREPFVGGGAVFFALVAEGRVGKAILGDLNHDLVELYTCVRDEPGAVIEALQEHRNDQTHYYRVRAIPAQRLSRIERAARFIFLNRCGYNGLYRVNASGQFNVPFGRYANPTICDAENLKSASRALQHAELRCGDFDDAETAERGDFVYFDPPYVPISRTASFTEYARGGFGEAEQIRLRDLAATLKRRGVGVLLSNSAVPFVRKIYAKGFRKKAVQARRMVNCRPNGRNGVAELVIW
jgi:DNA adenine methylase